MLKMENVRKSYDGFSMDCTLDVLPGRITGLIGPNGAGKSTAFKAALGLIHVEGGMIRILGKESGQFSTKDRQEIGAALSDSGFSGYLTVTDVIPVMDALYEHFNRDYFERQLEKFKLPGKKKIKDFSTGMKAKLKVLVAVSHGARLLILDEPTAGLDVLARDEILDVLREYMEQDEERSILISSHISSDLESLCDDLYMIDEGRIILHEDTDVLLSDYALLKVEEEQFKAMDKSYILCYKEEGYGYSCLTDQKQYYLENYPKLIAEKGSIDSVVRMLINGKKIGGWQDEGIID